MFERLRQRAHSARLRANVRLGRQTWGRQPGDNQLATGGEIPVAMPAQATIEAVVIEASTGRRLHPYTRQPLADGERVLVATAQVERSRLRRLRGE